MYNEKIEALIRATLADGELTEKEKQVLFKKAEAEGIDLDEFEVVLESRLFEKQEEMQKARAAEASKAAPKSDKLGDVRKCPGCGAIAETFATKCADCGTEFRNIGSNKNIIKFFEKLDEIESQRKESIYTEKEGFDFDNVGCGSIVKWLFFWWLLLPIAILKFIMDRSKPAQWSTTDSRKEDLIMNFPVPTAREEILEFLTLASSRIHSNTYFNSFSEQAKYKGAWNAIWMKKIDQIHTKAAIAMKNDKESFEDVNRITSAARSIIKGNNQKLVHIFVAFLIAIAILFVWGYNKSEEQRVIDQGIDKQVIEVESVIKNNDFVKADSLMNGIEDADKVFELKCKIELAKVNLKLDEIDGVIDKKLYTKAKLELDKISWTKISINSEEMETEKEYFNSYINRKNSMNDKLPKYKRIKIEETLTND